MAAYYLNNAGYSIKCGGVRCRDVYAKKANPYGNVENDFATPQNFRSEMQRSLVSQSKFFTSNLNSENVANSDGYERIFKHSSAKSKK